MAAGFSGNEDVAKYTNMGLNAGNSFAGGDYGGGVTGSLSTLGGAVGGDAGAGINAAAAGTG